MSHASLVVGRFVPGNGFWHRLDPRTKIVAPMIFAAALALSPHPTVVWAMVLGTLLAGKIGGVDLRRILAPLASMAWLLAITFATHLVAVPGQGIPGFPFVTREGLCQGLAMTGRLAGIMVTGQLLLVTTPALGMARGLERLLARLPLVGSLAGKVSILTSLTVRFIPLLFREWGTLRDSARIRGYLAGGLPVTTRLSREASLLVPLFLVSFRKADDLALSMHLRGYHPDRPRTSLHTLSFGARDLAVLTVLALLLAGVVRAALR